MNIELSLPPLDSVPREENKSYGNLNRLEKGYLYEIYIQNSLKRLGIDYTGNSKDYEEWKITTNTGYDIKVKDIQIECKFTLTKLFHSWIVRDWLSRSANIIVCSNKWNVRQDDRRLLKQYGKKVMDTGEFLWYIVKLHKEGNKPVGLNIYNSSNNKVRSSSSNRKHKDRRTLDDIFDSTITRREYFRRLRAYRRFIKPLHVDRSKCKDERDYAERNKAWLYFNVTGIVPYHLPIDHTSKA